MDGNVKDKLLTKQTVLFNTIKCIFQVQQRNSLSIISFSHSGVLVSSL